MDVGNGDAGAMYDQMQAEFSDLTARLVIMHQRLRQLASMPDSESKDHELGQIKKDLFDVLDQAFISDPDSSKVFNFVMFLVDQISGMTTVRMQIGQLINSAGTELNKIAETMGMAPVVGGPAIQAGLVKENNTYITGTGQILGKIHKADTCRGWCVIHNPLPGPWADWPTNWRGDGPFDDWRGFERLCPCGIGHTAMEHVFNGDPHPHGCCGLCPCGPPMAQPIYDPDTQEIVGYQ